MITRRSVPQIARCLGAVGVALLLLRCGGSHSGPSDTAPTVASIQPARGPAGGGTSVHIIGDHFAGGAVVSIGGAIATDVVVESPTSITAKTSVRVAGAADVAVTVGGRTGALAGGFTYDEDTPPVVTVVAQGTKPNEPKNFADLNEEVAVTAIVDDPDTPLDRLTFEWSAEFGTFNGSGSTVTWRAPTNISIPKDVVLTVAVSNSGVNRVTATTTVSVHDSRKEIGDLSRQFLLDFSDSKLDPAFVVRNFSKSPRCERERDDEFDEIATNRKTYQITSSFIGPATVTIQFASQPCSYEPRDGDACAAAQSTWDSICKPGVTCTPGRSDGIDFVTAAYEQSQWKLCASHYQPRTPLQPGFIR